MHLVFASIPVAVLLLSSFIATTSVEDDKEIVRTLDTRYQAAVRTHDVAMMDRILADEFILVTGGGKVFSKSDLLEEARDTGMVYQRQEDSRQTVRLWGHTAVITALLWSKGTDKGKPFDYHLWFSDTYVRTPSGWRYVFGQASLPLPAPPSSPR
jgi:ketosteroid isomerase-like protein